MIRIVCVEKAKERHFAYYNEKVLRKLEAREKSFGESSLEKTVFEYFSKNHKAILIGTPAELSKVIEDLLILLKSYDTDLDKMLNTLYNDIKEVYRYDLFVSRKKGWNAYVLSELLKVNVCPYCNRNYTYTIRNKNGVIARPEFDHFYPQNKYPFLALSLFNLVPSCHTCNHIKGKTDTFSSKIKYHHPYMEGYENTIYFNSGITLEKFLADGFKSEILISLDSSKSDNINWFHLNDIYSHHTDIAQDIFLKTQHYSKSTLIGLAEIVNNKDPSVDLYKWVLNNYDDPKDFGKRPFSKLVRDIARETGLLQRLRDLQTLL